MIETKAGGHIDVEKLERCIGDREVLIGFPSGVRHPDSDVDNDQLAEWLHDGTSTIPARPFLLQGIASEIEAINAAIHEAFVSLVNEGKANARKVGALAVGAVQRFVRGDYYRTHEPNSPETIRRKGSDTPLIDKAFLINSTTYVVRGQE